MRTNLYYLITGVLAAGHAVAALFFFRFWRQTRDRLFVWFSFAFLLLVLQRVVGALIYDVAEAHPQQYLLRLAAFIVIIVAIIDKNRAAG